MKFALLSVTYAGLFYSGKSLSLEEQILKAKKMGFDGLAIETKRPVASPLDLRKTDRARIKSVAQDNGITLCAIESLSCFTSRFMEDRENNLAMMKMVLELAKDLDVEMVKVFASWPGIVNDEEEIAMYGTYDRGNYYKRLFPPDLRKWNRAVEGIREVADWASDMGITIALQNHAPVLTPGYEDTLAMMREVDRKNVKICLDVPLFYDRQESDYVKKAVMECKDHLIYTHYGAWNFSESSDGEAIQDPSPSTGQQVNYEAFIDALYRIGYDGYLVSEYCLPALKDHKVAGIEEIDRGTMLSLRYMKDLMQKSVLAKKAKHSLV